MRRAAAFPALAALLFWMFSGCLNPATAGASTMECCAGMDCTAGEGEHDCCATMAADPHPSLLPAAKAVTPTPAIAPQAEIPAFLVAQSAESSPEETSTHRAHAPPLYTLHASFLI